MATSTSVADEALEMRYREYHGDSLMCDRQGARHNLAAAAEHRGMLSASGANLPKRMAWAVQGHNATEIEQNRDRAKPTIRGKAFQ